MLSAALRALRENLPTRLQAFTNAPDGELVFDSQLRICWGGGPVARLLPSGDVLAPKVEALPSDLLDGPAREEVRKRAATWVETRIRLGLVRVDGCPRHAPSNCRPVRAASSSSSASISACCRAGRSSSRWPSSAKRIARRWPSSACASASISLYFPSMLKPVPIRLRAGLWMIAHNRDSIPPLPAEGRTSMDLPQGAEREFYAAIGYVPLGNHAIRADMVERLAAMARQAVRESRESARRAQQDKQEKKAEGQAEAEPAASTPSTPTPAATPPSTDEISEWAIVAAAFGESEPEPAPEVPAPEVKAEEAAPETAPAEPIAYAAEETAPERPKRPRATQTERDGLGRSRRRPRRPRPKRRRARSAMPRKRPSSRRRAEAEASEPAPKPRPKRRPQEEPKPAGPRPLPPGWFRATPQMMSLVGCSEPEMADVLRGLGYRVHPPSDEHGPLHAFSVKPRFVREREEQRERQRQQERERRDQRRRERPEERAERASVLLRRAAPRPAAPGRAEAPDRPERTGPTAKPGGRGRNERSPARRPAAARGAPRVRGRRAATPTVRRCRLYATTEKKGDVSNSPFAKLLELKLGGKK